MPVGLVTVSIYANFVFFVVWFRIILVTCSGFSMGKDKGTTTVFAPDLLVMKSTVFQHA